MAKIYVDAGHGGSDVGAFKYLNERNINLVMAKACRDYLIKYGHSVKMSRTSNDQNPSLNHRCAECNAWGADLAISIHNNAGGGDGFEVIHSIGSSKGIKMSKNIEKEVIAIGQNSRGLKTKADYDGSDYFAFNRLINCPSIICEGLFVDNKTDVKIGDTTAEQKAFGVAYAKGILKTLGISTTATTSTKKSYSGTFPTLPSRGYFKSGDKGTQVKYLQKFVNWYGNYKLDVDGIIGSKTISAVKKFQEGEDLTVDGLFGKNSLSKAKTVKK